MVEVLDGVLDLLVRERHLVDSQCGGAREEQAPRHLTPVITRVGVIHTPFMGRA